MERFEDPNSAGEHIEGDTTPPEMFRAFDPYCKRVRVAQWAARSAKLGSVCGMSISLVGEPASLRAYPLQTLTGSAA